MPATRPRAGGAAGRAAALLFCLAAVSTSWCDGAHEEYENALRVLSSRAAGPAPLPLDVVVDLALNPPDEAAAPRLLEEQKAGIASLLRDRLVGSAFSLGRVLSLAELGPGLGRPAAGLGSAGAFDAKLAAACGTAAAVLLVQAEVLVSGTGGMSEITARLLEAPTGRELSRDVIWTTKAEGGAGTVFVNGVRIR
ncbi:MAG TPA: hypothetical protein VFL04_01440 [Rectinemataceae bacterium]|nr:hypothetical protein [Rectinemataceae bacterium]